MEKNHNHNELPHVNHNEDYTEDETQSALEFYVGDRLKNLPVATPADLKDAWGPVEQETLDAMNLVDLHTNDKEALEALEAKKKAKEAAKKKLPSKNTGANLAKIKQQKKKDRAAKKNDGGSENASGRPATPPPPPANQLGYTGSDNDETPKKGEFENT